MDCLLFQHVKSVSKAFVFEVYDIANCERKEA